MTDKFELQLIVIGALIAAYMQLIPALLSPILIGGIPLLLLIIKIGSYGLGLLWFFCLSIGTLSLANFEKKHQQVFKRTYDLLFYINNLFTLAVFTFIFIVYATYIVVYLVG